MERDRNRASSPPAPSGTAAQPQGLGGPPGHDILDRVAEVLARIRPAIQDDGGDIELVAVTEQGVVQVRLHGACVGCPSSSITLQSGIERNLRELVPGIRSVVAVP